MQLKITQEQVPNQVNGIHATILKDDVNGSVLVIQQLGLQLRVKLSDLIEFINFQQTPVSVPAAKKVKLEKTK